MKTEKPVFESRIIGRDEFKIGNTAGSLETFAKKVNELFIPLCQTSGIELTTALFTRIMNNPNEIRKIYIDQISSDCEKLGNSGKIIIESMIQTSEPVIRELEKTVIALHSFESGLSHSVFMVTGKGINLFSKIEIIGNKAMVSANAIREIEENFTFIISTPEQETAFTTLQQIAAGMTTIRKMLNNSLQIEFIPDREFFDIAENGNVVVNSTVIQCF